MSETFHTAIDLTSASSFIYLGNQWHMYRRYLEIFTKREFDRFELGMNISLDAWHNTKYTAQWLMRGFGNIFVWTRGLMMERYTHTHTHSNIRLLN